MKIEYQRNFKFCHSYSIVCSTRHIKIMNMERINFVMNDESLNFCCPEPLIKWNSVKHKKQYILDFFWNIYSRDMNLLNRIFIGWDKPKAYYINFKSLFLKNPYFPQNTDIIIQFIINNYSNLHDLAFISKGTVSYTHLRANETVLDI